MATATATLSKIERAHQMYRDGFHQEALGFYTEALAMAKTKAQKIALHSNRAACYLKLQDFMKAGEECTSVLELDHEHTGALMLRAQTLVTLKEYQSAFFDVNRLVELNPSSEVYQNLQVQLRTQLLQIQKILMFKGSHTLNIFLIDAQVYHTYVSSLAPIPESEEEALATDLEEEEQQKMLSGDADVEDRCKAVLSKSDYDQQGNDRNLLAISESERHSKLEMPIPPTENGKMPIPQTENGKNTSDVHSKGWQTIPKPQGHSRLDYSRWDRVEDDSSEEDDDDDEEQEQPQYRFRVRTVGIRPVK
ncbi:hypothetical protein QJS10_CPB11g01530 [Acorus calamus]|uniref:Uncharacterized protein n=1 Tax=Acorus calamus TaxID=4465 RepID=A0AAV9DVF4_ACOCL|nr:hypothetical protein QJS10_CPB11g01530 [Acorus calamus]